MMICDGQRAGSKLLAALAILAVATAGYQASEAQAPKPLPTYDAKVVSVKDGDSLTVLRSNERERVIMYGIDCPEIGQDFGAQAKDFTDQCCYNKVVTIQEHGTDKLGRIVAEVILSDGADLNKELVKRGLAWWSDKYAPGDTVLSSLQTNAKAQHLGLWSSPNPIPPWIFRNGDRQVKATIRPSSK